MHTIKKLKPLYILMLATLLILLFHEQLKFSINYALSYHCEGKTPYVSQAIITGQAAADSRKENKNEKKNYKNSPSQSKDAAPQCKYVNTVQNTVLAVNFNEPLYQNIPLLKKFFDPVFGKVVFCGSKRSNKYDVIKISGQHGFQGYDCLAKAMELHPIGYTGYMHTNDDVILNYWNLSFDPNRIWIGEKFFLFRSHIFGKPPRNDWSWWRREETTVRCEKTFQVLKNTAISEFDLRPNFKIYYKNTGGRNLCTHGNSDFFYVPQKHAAAYKFIASKFVQGKVFLEAAVPTILFLLDRYELFENVKGLYYVYGKPPRNNFYYNYNFDRIFMHPFKLYKNFANQKFFELAWGAHGRSQNEKCKQKTIHLI